MVFDSKETKPLMGRHGTIFACRQCPNEYGYGWERCPAAVDGHIEKEVTAIGRADLGAVIKKVGDDWYEPDGCG